MADYTDQDAVEDYLKRSLSSEEEALLELLQEAVKSFIDDETGSNFDNSTAGTRYYDGGEPIIDIDPVRNVTAVVTVDTKEAQSHEYALNEDFELRPRNETIKKWIEKRYNAFPSGVANIAVTGIFTSSPDGNVPKDIKYLATYLIGKLYQSQSSGNLKSESIEGYSRTFAEFMQSDNVVSTILNKYTKDDVVI